MFVLIGIEVEVDFFSSFSECKGACLGYVSSGKGEGFYILLQDNFSRFSVLIKMLGVVTGSPSLSGILTLLESMRSNSSLRNASILF